MDKNIDFKDDKVLVLHNSIVEARYNMNLNENKLFIALVSLIKKDDDEFREYEIKSEKLINIFNISNEEGIYEITKRVSDGLMKRIIFIEDKGKKYWIKYSIFSRMEYKNGNLYVKFNSDISPFLLKLSESFTQFNLAEFKPFTSKYSIRIYELLKQYQRIGERTFDIENLKLQLGIEKGGLKKIIDFKRYVVNIAQRELENTFMAFDYKMIKSGRKFTRIKFTLKYKLIDAIDVEDKSQNNGSQSQSKDNMISAEDISEEELRDLYSLIPAEQVTKSLEQIIQKYYIERGLEYIKNAIGYVNKQKPKNYLAYLKSTLENHYSEVFEKEKIFESERMKEEQRRERISEVKNKIQDIIFRRDVEIERTAKAVFESMSGDLKERIVELAKISILKEDPSENVNSTDHIFKARLDIAINNTVKSLYPDKIKEVSDSFDKATDELKKELNSI